MLDHGQEVEFLRQVLREESRTCMRDRVDNGCSNSRTIWQHDKSLGIYSCYALTIFYFTLTTASIFHVCVIAILSPGTIPLDLQFFHHHLLTPKKTQAPPSMISANSERTYPLRTRQSVLAASERRT